MAYPANLVFFGTDAFSDTTLKALLTSGYNIGLVITKPDAPVGRKRILTSPAVKITAERHNIPVAQPERLLDLVDTLQGHFEAGIVVAYGKIIPQAFLDSLPGGLINVHGSLLTKYRGASPIEATLLNGDPVTGISLMKLDAGMDTGPIYTEAQYEIQPGDNQATLYEKLALIGADILVRDLDAILDGTLTSHPQEEAKATKVGMIKKSDGEIDWTKPAHQIANQIRAYVTWPGSKATIGEEEVTITSASELQVDVTSEYLADQEHIYSENAPAIFALKPGVPFKTPLGYLGVSCGENTSLVILQLKPVGKREMTGKEFLAGHPLS